MTAQDTTATVPTAREARKFALKHTQRAADNLYGKGGLSKAEKLERLEEAKAALLKAYSAVEHAISETAKETEVDFEPATIDATPVEHGNDYN